MVIRPTYPARAFAHVLQHTRDRAKYDSERRLLDVLAALHGPTEQLQSSSVHRFHDETDQAYEKRVFGNADKLRAAKDRTTAKYSDALAAELQRSQHELDTRVNLKPDEYAAETRAQFRSLPDQGAKIDFLNELVAENSGPALAALIKAPKALTGIPREMASKYIEVVYSKHAPDAWDEHKAILRMVTMQLDILRSIENAISEYSNPARLAEIARKDEEARQAQERFDTSTGGVS